MTEFKPTHIGQLSGDARVNGRMPKVHLRETKTFWISRHGTKFRKADGWPTGDDPYPLWHLLLETVRPLCPKA